MTVIDRIFCTLPDVFVPFLVGMVVEPIHDNELTINVDLKKIYKHIELTSGMICQILIRKSSGVCLSSISAFLFTEISEVIWIYPFLLGGTVDRMVVDTGPLVVV